MSFAGGAGGGGSGELTWEQKQQFKKQVSQNVESQLMQGIISSMSDTCFKKCVTRPTGTLTSGEADCLGKCANRYADVMKVVGRALEQEITESRAGQPGGF